jgi:hypothetical protein
VDFTPQVRQQLEAMPPKQAAAFIRYFRAIEACQGDHPQSWPAGQGHMWITEFDGRGIRYSREPGSGPRPVKVSAIW